MSMELYVTSGSELPSASQIAEALEGSGISLIVASINWNCQSGFLPMVLNGADAGVEVDLVPHDECAEVVAPFGGLAETECQVVALRWGGKLSECACALAMASAIASLGGGRVLDPQDATTLSAADSLRQARDCIKGLG